MDLNSQITNTCPSAIQGVSGHFFLTLINRLFLSQCSLDRQPFYPPDYSTNLKEGDEFDFIVVGSGSAGSVVANRLSEVNDWKVLVLEAGGYSTTSSEIPALLFNNLGTNLDWQYNYEPSDVSGFELKNKRGNCPRGKGIGGTSLLNGMLYVRGNKRDLDNWAKAGNTGWDYKSVLKHFQENENVNIAGVEGYGNNGYLRLSRYTCPDPLRQGMGEAYRELGYGETKNFESGYQDALMNLWDGTRFDTGKAFVQSIKGRKNLHVSVNSQVTKILIEDNSVKGVEVKVNDKLMKLYVKKEVIISAGAINSPQILMNSGVGPKDHLESVGIQVIKDLKVGENFQDHPVSFLFTSIDESAFVAKSDQDNLDDLYNYFMHRKGTLGTIAMTNLISFTNTKKDSSYPNIQMHHFITMPSSEELFSLILSAFGIGESLIARLLERGNSSAFLVLVPTLLNPKSRGKILLNSSNPFDKPLIHANLLTDENNEDIETLLQGMKEAVRILDTDALKKFKPKIVDAEIEQCKQYIFKSDDYWKCYLINLASNIFHPVGTCKMEPPSDPDAVVDPRLRVHGLKGIRVMDASIMPFIVSGNPNAASIMIGQKGSTMIKEDWLKTHNEL